VLHHHAGQCCAAGAGPSGGATSPAAQPALSAEEIVLDFSPAAQVLQLWLEPDDAVNERARAIATDVPYQTLREFLFNQMRCEPSDAEVTGAIVDPAHLGVCGFGLEPAWRERAALDSLLYLLVARSTAIRARVADDVRPYVPTTAWKPIRVWFVIASRWMFDAVTLDHGMARTLPVVLFNLSEALEYGTSTEERAAIVERVLAHETFHAALRQMEFGAPGWMRYHEPRNALDHIARVMLDEGVAHFIDWRERPGADTLFVAKPGAREQKAFSQLALACKRLQDPRTDPGARGEILGLAATGPLWSKYGAISGMFAASRIDRAWGADSLKTIVGRGPHSLLRAYASLAAADTSLKALPKELYTK
jgi:hypothetical protein